MTLKDICEYSLGTILLGVMVRAYYDELAGKLLILLGAAGAFISGLFLVLKAAGVLPGVQ